MHLNKSGPARNAIPKQFTLNDISQPPREHSLIEQVLVVDSTPVPSQRNYSTYSPTKRYQHPPPPDSLSRASRDQPLERTNDSRNQYQHVQRILRQENTNLKGQNQLLLAEIERLRRQNRKYKELCAGQQVELEGVRAESAAQRARGDQMKVLISSRLTELEQECLQGESVVEIDGLTDSNRSVPYD